MNRGVLYIAYGDAAKRQFQYSVEAWRRVDPAIKIAVVSDDRIAHHRTVISEQRDKGARWQKVNLNRLTPFKHTLYLDADTRVFQSPHAGFEALSQGWEMAIAPSAQQGDRRFWHIDAEEKAYTDALLGVAGVLQWQCGVMFFRHSVAVNTLFTKWRGEWERFGDQDQAAFCRALRQNPVKIWPLGRPFNGGEIIRHYHGMV